MQRKNQEGFTLIELLIAIVVVGVLTAVAIVGISGLTNKGETSACQATKDATKAAVAVHYANNNGAYPANIAALTGANELDVPSGVTAAGQTLTANGWTVTLGAGTGAVTATC